MSEHMPQGPDPLGIRADARYVAAQSDHVSIDRAALADFCCAMAADGRLQMPSWELEYHFVGADELTVAYIFVLDTINFCFWGDPRWHREYEGHDLRGYWALAAALTQEARTNPGFFEADALATLDTDALAAVLAGQPPIPLLDARADNLRALGAWIAARFHGRFSNLLEAVDFDAITLARTLVDNLASFRDEAMYKGRKVRFYKRAQILPADLYGALQGKAWGKIRRVPELTMFADYRVPQLLRHHGILRYSDALAARVDNHVEIEAGTDEEVELRANTIWAVELMRAALSSMQIEVASYQVDWLLWASGEQRQAQLKPHHRTRTIYY